MGTPATSHPECADRPIQVVDWVECVDATGRSKTIAIGKRYQVERALDSDPRRPRFALVGIESPAFGWCASRFKRVDGPHPKDPSGCVHCGESAGCAENCVTRADEASELAPVPQCSDCSAAATYGKRCVYCNARDSRDEFETMMAMTREPVDREAGDRLAAWSRAERPRGGNPTNKREFAKPHPWPEFDPLESR